MVSKSNISQTLGGVDFFYKYCKKVINVCDDLLNLSAEAISSLRGPLKNYKEWGDPGRLGSCALSGP